MGVGVIGAGVISDTYLTNLTSFPDLRVLFVADLDTARAAAQAAKFGVPSSGTVAELLATPDIELVVNLTVPSAHVDVGLAALESGKHVWAEKPLAMDRQTGRKLLDRARERGLRVASAPDTVLGAGLQTARRAVDAGTIGTPLSALALFQVPGPEIWHPSPEFLYQPGAGPLLDMGPYYLTTLIQLFGPIRRVTGSGARAQDRRVIASGPKAGTEFPVDVLMIFFRPAGVRARRLRPGRVQLRLQARAAGPVGGHRFSFGTAVLPDPNKFRRQHPPASRDEPEELAAQGQFRRARPGALELARSIRAGVPERASGELATTSWTPCSPWRSPSPPAIP
ncbi:Gfo/Idh/MocA family protein [Kutzneria sp. 744]|uniref:Gfo/Idh/MocA family protein n=1 Tax=Kutzneria sp. (strain 744) TaxID=345341 RepID=UPI0004B1FA59|nr:Gfo/Idh/MocA family oxidoreductase [Kutzneria sp. 744]